MKRTDGQTAVKSALINLLFPLVSVAAMIALYAIAAAVVGESLVLPKISEILKEAGKLAVSAEFYKALVFTLLRALAAFAAAFVVGSALAVAANRLKPLKKALAPIMTFLRAVPTMAVIFLLTLWFRSVFAPVVVAFTVLMPLSYSQTAAALASLDDGIFEMCKVYKVPKKKVLTKFVLPQIVPQIADSAAGNLSFGVKLVIAGEALAQTAASLGGALNLANIYIDTARRLAITLSAVAVCCAVESAVRLVALLSRRWR